MENILKEDLDHILENTAELWEEVRDKRIFITGGTGFFGCWLLESFAWANAKLDLNAYALVLTRNPEAFRRKSPHLFENPSLNFYAGDVRDFTFPEGEFSHIIHAATGTDARPDMQDPVSLFDGIVRGSRHTLEFARHCTAKKFLLTSSGAVYGKQPYELTHIPEEYTGAPETITPLSAYGEAKRVSEFLSAMYSDRYGFEAKIARCFAFVGPYLPLNMNYAIGNFIRDGLNGGPIRVEGDGTPFRSYLYAADLAIWLWTILLRGASCRPYNVGSELGISISDLAKVVAGAFQPELEVKIAKQPSPEKESERYVPSVRRVQCEMGLKQNTDLREAIRRTVSWHSRL